MARAVLSSGVPGWKARMRYAQKQYAAHAQAVSVLGAATRALIVRAVNLIYWPVQVVQLERVTLLEQVLRADSPLHV